MIAACPRFVLRWSALMLLLLGTCWSPLIAQSNTDPVPLVQEAESTFALGLQAYTDGNYSLAHRYFVQVAREQPLNRKTTASWLMAGRALYQEGNLRQAIRLLETFTRTYSTSSYVDEAFDVIAEARQQLQAPTQPKRRVFNLGILLPLDNEAALLSQALFNGMRLAVDEFNARGGSSLVRMVFREASADSAQLDATVRAFKQMNTDLVVGPLFSEEAETAAVAAESVELPLFVPLATAENLTNRRSFVFQANPTFTTQGRAMGRFAVRNLRLDTLGVLSVYNDANPSAEFMAMGFETGVLNAGGSVLFYESLPDAASWYRLSDFVGRDSLAQIKALYVPLPVREANTQFVIGAALGSLDRTLPNLRILGNEEWHDLPFRLRLGNHTTTYATAFQVDSTQTEVDVFEQAYQNLTGERPDPTSEFGYLAFVGYDIGRYLIARFATATNDLPTAIREAAPFDGLGVRLDFSNGPTNEGMFFFRYRNDILERIR